MPPRPMFLILGSPRSGTSLLARTLDVHDWLVVPEETDFIVPAAFICHRVEDASVGKELIRELVVSSSAFPRSLRAFMTDDEVARAIDGADYSIYSIVSAIYDRLAYNDWAKMAGDKSPNDLAYLPILVETGFFDGDVKVIHVVRDVRDVVSSLVPLGWSEHDAEGTFARAWSNANLYAYDRLHTMEGRYLLIKYERMVGQPEEVLREACDFLEVPYQPKMLDPAHRRLRGPPEHLRNLTEPISASRVGTWRQGMDPELRRRCERQAAEALTHFGYWDSAG